MTKPTHHPSLPIELPRHARSKLKIKRKPKGAVWRDFSHCYKKTYFWRERRDGRNGWVVHYHVKLSGNRCGHKPDEFQPLISKSPYDTPKGEKPRFTYHNNQKIDPYGFVLRHKSQYEAVMTVNRYYANPDVIPSIRAVREMDALKRGTKSRQRKTEGREADTLVLSTLIMNLDIASMRIGSPNTENPKDFYYLSIDGIAAQCGISASRVATSLDVLKRAGMIGRSRRYKKDEEDKKVYYGKPSAMWLTRDGLASLGLTELFDTAYKEIKEAKRKGYKAPKTPQQIQAEAQEKMISKAISSDWLKKINEDLEDDPDREEEPA